MSKEENEDGLKAFFCIQTMTLISLLKTIQDPRSRRGRRHQLWLLMFLSLLGDLCGYRGYRPLASFANDYHQRWCKLLNLDPSTTPIPSHSTKRRVFLRVEAQSWVDAFNRWANTHVPHDLAHQAIDGKSIRATRSGDLQSGYDYASLVSAYSKTTGVVQLQLIFNKKESEIPAARHLVSTLATLSRAAGSQPVCFSFDALHTQVETLALVEQQHCHYLVGLKPNQRTLYRKAQ